MASVQGIPQLQARLRAVGQVGPTTMQRLALTTVREAKALVPRKTSNLSRSITIVSATERSAVVRASANYAAFVEFGTRPHDIYPRRKRALAWAATSAGRRLTGSPRKATRRGAFGGLIIRRHVHHPGTRPHPFLGPGAQKAIETMDLAGTVVRAWDGAA